MIPAVSVILPVYNAAPYVEAAVQSILAQSFENFELLLIDDGSTDDSAGILRRLAGTDVRIRLIQRENKGLIASLNEGLALARATFVARMDADDIALPRRLALQYQRMCADEDLVVLGSAIQYIDDKGRMGRSVSYPEGAAVQVAALWGAPVAHPATMFRTAVARSAGGYPTTFPHAEDYAFWLQLLRLGHIDNLSEVVLHYRVHGQSISHVHALLQRTSTLRAQALWLADMEPLPELMAISSNEDFLESLPLPEATRTEIIARMLALSPHMLGDEQADAETAQWLSKALKSVQNPVVRQGLAWFHLRAICYCDLTPQRKLKHLCQAVQASPRGCLALLRKYIGR